jgi:hypothetical protein
MILLIHGQEGYGSSLEWRLTCSSTSWLWDFPSTLGQESHGVAVKHLHIYKLVTELFSHGQEGQKHALEVMSFHPLRGGLPIFSSFYKLVAERFNHSREGYNML